MQKIEKISTGIENFDELLGGGFPKGSTIVYYGPPSTGKTICSLFFLYAGMKKKEKTLYVTFEEGEGRLIQLANTLGIDINEFIINKLFVIRDFSRFVSEKGVEKSILDKIKTDGITRVVIDSLTAAMIDNLSNGNAL